MIVAPTIEQVRAVDRRVACVFDRASRAERIAFRDVERRTPWATPDELLRALSVSVSASVGCAATQAPSQEWTPADDSGGRVWLEGDYGYTPGASGATATWLDRYGLGNDLTQATHAKKPSTTTINGLQALRLSAAASQSLSRASFVGGALSQPNTIFAVFKTSSGTASDAAVFDGNAARQLGYVQPVAGKVGLFAGLGPMMGPAGFVAQTLHLVCWVVNGASTKIYVDNMVTEYATVDPGTNGLNGLFVGQTVAASAFFDGDIAALIVRAGAADATLRGNFKTYLNRWKSGGF